MKTGKYIMSLNGKSLLSGQERGFIKLVAEEGTGRLLGAQLMCARATDMIGVPGARHSHPQDCSGTGGDSPAPPYLWGRNRRGGAGAVPQDGISRKEKGKNAG